MVVGTLLVTLRLSGCHNLKEKRSILNRLMDRIRSRFPLSVAEVDDQELWGNATVGAAMVSSNPVLVDSILKRAVDLIESFAEVEVTESIIEIERRQ